MTELTLKDAMRGKNERVFDKAGSFSRKPSTSQSLRLVLAQLDFLVGDIEGNRDKIIEVAQKAHDKFRADLVVFPELALTGYPPDDLLFRPALYQRVNNALKQITEQIQDIYIVLGYPEQPNELDHFNAACVIYNGKIIAKYYKQMLPNYQVFDEKRYFQSAHEPCLFKVNNIPIGLIICEDLWHPEPAEQSAKAGAKILLSINASPYDRDKPLLRQELLAERTQKNNIPIAYVNIVGGQDELVFDGGSMMADETGQITHKGAFCKEELMPINLHYDGKVTVEPAESVTTATPEEHVYEVLVLGIRDYIEKNQFPGAVIGLSGGIDSALTLAIAVDAIGKDRVEAVMMPSRYTKRDSLDDAAEQAKICDIDYKNISIEPMFQAFLTALKEEFKGLPPNTTEENIQARCRGVILMAISNKKGLIVLSTGNKSELSVGYSTLYGDLVGGFCVLKDVPKTWVYRLANYRNRLSPIIPKRVIEKAPSAELAPDQKDTDTLPPYNILDQILERYIEHDQSVHKIIAAGFDPEIVRKVASLVDRNEYKRRQAPIGVRISQRAFGRDRRYPITSGYGKYFQDD